MEKKSKFQSVKEKKHLIFINFTHFKFISPSSWLFVIGPMWLCTNSQVSQLNSKWDREPISTYLVSDLCLQNTFEVDVTLAVEDANSAIM